MMQIALKEFTMAYSESGEGIPLLLIHGFPLNRHLWRPQIDGLASDARVLAPDLRGHGDSSATQGPYTMDLLADDLSAFLDKIQISRPVVICGLSMGGYVAFAFYRRYASRVAGLILTSTRAADDTKEGKQGRDDAAVRIQQEGTAPVIDGLLPKLISTKTFENNPNLVAQVRAVMEHVSTDAYLGDLLGMKERPDSRPDLKRISVPTLVIHGTDDQIIPLHEAQTMQAAVPDARLEIIPGAGHLPNLEKPDIFNQKVRLFLALIGGKGE